VLYRFETANGLGSSCARATGSSRGRSQRGAVKGAAGEAAFGAIAGDAGEGAAIGATVGAVKGRRQQKKRKSRASNRRSRPPRLNNRSNSMGFAGRWMLASKPGDIRLSKRHRVLSLLTVVDMKSSPYFSFPR